MSFSEDRLAAKLQGKNGLIRFIDGEEFYFHEAAIGKKGAESEWFTDIEHFLNDKEVTTCVIGGIAVNKVHVKYIRRL